MPKLIHELQSPDISALKPKVIAVEIEEIARPAYRFRQLLRENRDLVNKPGDAVEFTYRYGAATFQKVATKLTEVSWSVYGWSTVKITVEKWGGKLQFAREDLEAANRDIIAESIYEAGQDWADTVDKECKLAIYKAVESTTTIPYGGEANAVVSLPTGTQLLNIISVTGSVTGFSSADFYKGKIELNNSGAWVSGATATVKYYHSELPSTQFKDAYSHGSFAFRDLQTLRNTILSQLYTPTIAVLHPNQIATLMRDSEAKFLDASAYGAREPILNGEIGKAAGLKLLDTVNQWEETALAIDPDHAGRFVIKKELESIREEKPAIYGLEYNLWAFFKAGLIRDKAVSIVVNVGGTAKSW